MGIIGRSEEDIKEFLIALKSAADAMEFEVNEGKTKRLMVKKING
jgi:hypothetical protein